MRVDRLIGGVVSGWIHQWSNRRGSLRIAFGHEQRPAGQLMGKTGD
jgi:hypothetical protein